MAWKTDDRMGIAKKLNLTQLCIEKDGWGKGQNAKRYFHYPPQTVCSWKFFGLIFLLWCRM